MLTSEELILLESLLKRARHSAGSDRVAHAETITPGDVVQLRPGACPHWQTSLLLVSKIRYDGGISGTILRPHRSGCREAWYTYRPPEVARIGRSPFPEPGMEKRRWDYCPPCPLFSAEPKPIQRETRGRKRKLANPAEIQDAIEALPNDQQEALAAWMYAHHPIQQETRAGEIPHASEEPPAKIARSFGAMAPIPANERLVRPLAALPPEEREQGFGTTVPIPDQKGEYLRCVIDLPALPGLVPRYLRARYLIEVLPEDQQSALAAWISRRQDVIEALPKKQQAALAAWLSRRQAAKATMVEPKPIQRETRSGEMIDAAKVIENLSTIVVKPQTESQAGELVSQATEDLAKDRQSPPAATVGNLTSEYDRAWMRAHQAVKEAMKSMFPVKRKPIQRDTQTQQQAAKKRE